MPEIGATLREARMRARIDISEIEAETKIRAKYLRALENEEWNLLPGPTYVKTFLRTYAEALGLDAKLLVEEYKLRHERLSDNELARPIGPTRATSGGRGRAQPQPVLPRSYLVAGLVLALCVVVFILSRVGGSDDSGDTSSVASTPSVATTAPRTTTPSAVAQPTREREKRRPASTIVKLKIVPTAPVYVCMDAKGQGLLIDGATLDPGAAAKTYKSSRFRIVLGNSSFELRVGGKVRRIPAAARSDAGVFVQVTKKAVTPLPRALRPGCTG